MSTQGQRSQSRGPPRGRPFSPKGGPRSQRNGKSRSENRSAVRLAGYTARFTRGELQRSHAIAEARLPAFVVKSCAARHSPRLAIPHTGLRPARALRELSPPIVCSPAVTMAYNRVPIIAIIIRQTRRCTN
jgi:hypothetical protein